MGTQGLENAKKIAICEYDFAIEGGAVGDITLRGNVLPAGAYIVGGCLDVETALASGGAATLAVKSVAAGDLLPATGKATFEANSVIGLGPNVNGGKLVGPTTAPTYIKATVGTAALTAGKFTVAVEYIVTR
jgi:hypothetical protein